MGAGGAVAVALRAARRSGQQTEIMADRTDVSQTFADPDGSLTTSVSALPRWVKDGSSWVSADASLVKQAGGTWAPAAALGGLSLSGGGSGLLATERSGSQSLSVTWPAALPAPTVSGAAATYAGVFPGVNLVVTADVSGGFSETLVIADQAAASDPQLQDLSLGVAASTGLSAHAGDSGTLAEETSSGSAVFFSPTPLAWDSAGAGASVSGPGGPGAHVAEPAAGYTAGSVKLGVPASLAAEPAADFPVYVDPSYSVASTMLTHGVADSDYPTGFFWSSTEMGAGKSPSSGVQRSYFRMNFPSQMSGSTIQSATFADTATNAGAAASTAHTVDLYSTGAISTSTTWDNQPSRGASTLAAFTTASTTPNLPVSWNVATLVQTAVNSGYPNWTLALVNANETAAANWVAFGDDPTISVTYTGGTAGVPVGTGPVSNATFLRFPVSDKVSLQVNVGSGDALVTTSDLSLPEISGPLTLGVSYNSLLTGSGVAQGSDGYGWRQSEGTDVRLYPNSDGAVTYLGEDGTAGIFTAPVSGGTTYGSPPVFHATLTSAPSSTGPCSGSAYQLTWHSTGEAMCFNSSGTLTSEVDRNGNTTAYTYNGNGQETQITYTPAGLSSPTETVTATWTGSYLTGLSQSGGSAGTKTITYGVNASGDLTSVKQADNTVITLGYDGSHDLTSIENGAGATTILGYNSTGQVTSVAQTYGSSNATATTRLAYVSATETEVADPNTNQSEPITSGQYTDYTLNSQDLATTTAQKPTGSSRTAAYDPIFGNVTSSTNGLQNGTTTNTYGANGGESLTQSQSPTGAVTSLAYPTSAGSGSDPNALYQPSSSTDAQNNATAYKYDGPGNQLSSDDALAAKAQVSYYSDGVEKTSTTPAPDNAVTSYTPSPQNPAQIITVTPPASGSSLKPIQISYDGFGRVSTVTNGDGDEVTYTYDLADRIKQEAYTGPQAAVTVSYYYDGAGNLKTQTDSTGTTGWTYDGRNQVLTKTAASGGGTLTYNYDADGNLITSKDAGGTTTYNYNALNQLASLDDPTGAVWKFTYNNADERLITYFDTNSTETTYAEKEAVSYDAAGRITEIITTRDSASPATVSDIAYSYTKYSGTSVCTAPAVVPATTNTDLLQYSTNKVTGAVSQYCYDIGNRLIEVTNDNGTTYNYGYDFDGDMQSGSNKGAESYNSVSQLTNTGYTYDGAGQQTATPGNGTATYNDAGQLTGLSDAGGNGQENITYTGAAQDEVLSDGSVTAITYGLAGQDGQPWIQSYTPAGSATDYIIHDQQGDELGYIQGGTSYAFATDNLGSVTAVVNSSGTTVASYTYDPYGHSNTSTGTDASQNLLDYTGALVDPASSNYLHFGDRWYNPVTDNFTSQDLDTFLNNPANGNRYAYAADDPANNIDPTGYSPLNDIIDVLGGIGFVAGVVGGALAAAEVAPVAAAVLFGVSIATGEPAAVVTFLCNVETCGS
jgi:RHS repeat-associated protein